MNTTPCDCEIGFVHWTYDESVGVCPECACVYKHSDRVHVEVYSVGGFLEACRLTGRYAFGGEC